MRLKRRSLIGWSAGAIGITLAGCLGDDDDDELADQPGDDEEPTDDDDATDDGPDDVGDDDLPSPEGLVYAFAPDEINLVDPTAGEVVQTVASDLGGRDWGDAVLTRDASKIFAVEGSIGQVAVIETATHELVEWVDIGPGPTHAFQPVEDEIWAHSDGEASLYVIDISSHEVIEIVEAGPDNEGHGKLVYQEDLHPAAYATNTNSPVGIAIDLEEYERTDLIEFGDGPGTHYVEYGSQNGLLYFEWFGGETPVVDPATNDVVDRLDVTGGLNATPDGRLLGMWDDDEIHFFDITSEDSEQLGTVDLEGRGPDDIKYFERDGTWYAFVANTTSPDVSVIDTETLEVVDHLPAGAIDQDAERLHRSGTTGDSYYVTAAEAEGTVAVIDMETLEVLHEIEVAEGVDTVTYVEG